MMVCQQALPGLVGDTNMLLSAVHLPGGSPHAAGLHVPDLGLLSTTSGMVQVRHLIFFQCANTHLGRATG